jgi:hypothetical protein
MGSEKGKKKEMVEIRNVTQDRPPDAPFSDA